MIHWVTFRNFKALRDVALRLNQQLTVIVGPNAAGKTSILEGLCHLSQMVTRQPEEYFQGDLAPDLLHSTGAKDPMELFFRSNRDGLCVIATEPKDFPANADQTWSYEVKARTTDQSPPGLPSDHSDFVPWKDIKEAAKEHLKK